MKKNLLSVLIASFVLALTLDANAQSSESDKSEAEKVAIGFLKMANMDGDIVGAARKFALNASVEELENASAAELFAFNDEYKENMHNQQKLSGCFLKDIVVDPKRTTEIIGNVARVWILNVCENGNTKQGVSLLRKENGVWKIDTSAEESEE